MYCNSCKNKINDNDLFCSICGSKIEKNTKVKKALSKILNNLNMFYLFSINLCLLFFGTIIGFFQSMEDMTGGSGFFILIMPFISGMLVIPHLIGAFLSKINIKRNKYILLILMFIASLFSIYTTTFSYELSETLLFWVNIILSILLSIALLIKLVLK